MDRFAGLWRDSWWLWVAVLALACALAWFVSPVFLCALPICTVAFVYFGYIRYDESGNRREGL